MLAPQNVSEIQGGTPADENTPFRPKSPYGVAKASAFWQVSTYRERAMDYMHVQE